MSLRRDAPNPALLACAVLFAVVCLLATVQLLHPFVAAPRALGSEGAAAPVCGGTSVQILLRGARPSGDERTRRVLEQQCRTAAFDHVLNASGLAAGVYLLAGVYGLAVAVTARVERRRQESMRARLERARDAVAGAGAPGAALAAGGPGEEPARVPSVSALLLLEAPNLLPPASPLRRSTRIPASGARVNTEQLATLLVAAALAHLRDAGVVGLSVVERRRSLRSRLRLSVEGGDQPAASGVPQALLRAAGAAGGVRELVRKWIGRSRSPFDAVVDAARSELADLGYLRDARPGRAQPGAVPLASLDSHRAQCARWWASFRLREAQLSQRLLEECHAAIAACGPG